MLELVLEPRLEGLEFGEPDTGTEKGEDITVLDTAADELWVTKSDWLALGF